MHDRSIVMHADTTTPVGMTDAFLTLFPVIVGLPPLLWRVGTLDGISMAAQCSLTLRPA
ncbi:hypothetical protein LAW93_12705 [Escherichia coli]|nr:hypothetical protein [Escherichia coli]